MKKILLLALSITTISAYAQQNVGIGTNTPETKLQVNGAISLSPADDVAAGTVTIPDNVSIFRLRLSAGGGITTLSVVNPKEGQLLTIYNEDDNAATFNGNSILAITGVSSFAYINGGWRMTASNSINGPVGPQGPAGPQGPQGTAGAAGAVGPQGPAGPQGSVGPAGAAGPQGPQGTPGAAGAVGPQGPAGPQGSVGPAGAAGPAGPQGPQGTVGAAGAVGPQGPAGPQGSVGPAGAAGAVGPQGPAGAVGPQGAQGPQGTAGLLPNGAAAGNTPYWNGSSWVVNSSNIYNNGGNVGIGLTPSFKFDVAGKTRLRRTGYTMDNANEGQLEIAGAAGDATFISFHREGAYGAQFGLETDNWFSTRGWSAGTNGYTNMRVGSLDLRGQYLFGTAGAANTYGTYTVRGEKNGWSGIGFQNSGGTLLGTLMVNADISGFFNNADNAWDWYWQNGWLTAGTVPGSRSYSDQSNAAEDFNVAKILRWKNYGSGHVIFDASQSTSPSGTAVNNTDAQVAWSPTYPTIMGWNGVNTYGVRVDRARAAETSPEGYPLQSTVHYSTKAGEAGFDGASQSVFTTPSFNVEAGARYKVTTITSLRWTGGSGEDAFQIFVNVNGCSFPQIGRHVTAGMEPSGEHNVYHTFAFESIYEATCTGAVTLNITVGRFDADDNFRHGDVKVLVTKF